MRLTPLLLLLTGLACLAPAPAAAQIVGKPDYGPVARINPFLPDSRPPGPSPALEARHIKERIGEARAAGLLTRREARQLERQADLITRLGYRYGRDGLSRSERAELDSRAAALRAELNRPRR